jgi:hypothetical protein
MTRPARGALAEGVHRIGAGVDGLADAGGKIGELVEIEWTGWTLRRMRLPHTWMVAATRARHWPSLMS